MWFSIYFLIWAILKVKSDVASPMIWRLVGILNLMSMMNSWRLNCGRASKTDSLKKCLLFLAQGVTMSICPSRPSVCSAQVCLKHWIFIFLSQVCLRRTAYTVLILSLNLLNRTTEPKIIRHVKSNKYCSYLNPAHFIWFSMNLFVGIRILRIIVIGINSGEIKMKRGKLSNWRSRKFRNCLIRWVHLEFSLFSLPRLPSRTSPIPSRKRNHEKNPPA